MKKSKLLLWAVILISALASQVFAVGAVQKWSAQILSDRLASDWCQQSVIIGEKEYSLDAESYSLVNNAFSKSSTPVAAIRQVITYYETDHNWAVICGHGFSKLLPQIHIVSFVPKTLYATASIQPNMLPSDGCDYTVTIKWVSYAVDSFGHNLIQELYNNVSLDPQQAYIRKIQYVPTGKQGTVQCGRGTTHSLPEIKLLGLYVANRTR